MAAAASARGLLRMQLSLRHIACAMTAVVPWIEAGIAQAQPYPYKPIRILVGFTPGTTTDILARTIGQKLTENFSQQVIIENRDGAGGTIAATLAARANPDGYTLWLAASGQYVISPILYRALSYDPLKDFSAIGRIAEVPNVLVVHPSMAAKSVKELVALAKSKPGVINYASSGKGSASHLNAELFKAMTGVDMVEIPYKSSAQAATDLLGGQVSLNFPSLPATISQIRSGKLRALAVTGAKRSQAMPDLPTMAEAGVAGYEASNTYWLAAPAGLQRSIVVRLNRELNSVLAMPDVRERLAGQGAEPLSGAPEDLTAYIKGDLIKWGKLIDRIGLRIE